MSLDANLGMHPGLPVSGETNVILPFEEFSVDLEHNLGRANGNCYQRRPGIPGGHDGQIMVRLKKKRFIILDYSIVPTPADIAMALVTPHIRCPAALELGSRNVMLLIARRLVFQYASSVSCREMNKLMKVIFYLLLNFRHFKI